MRLISIELGLSEKLVVNEIMGMQCWRLQHGIPVPAVTDSRICAGVLGIFARKKKQIASDDAQKLAKRRIELEKGRHDAAEDLSELSEGEKEKEEGNQTEAPTEKIARIISVVQMWSEEKENNKSDAHYIVLISLHGLVRGENMELGRDSDTGGQVKYVVN